MQQLERRGQPEPRATAERKERPEHEEAAAAERWLAPRDPQEPATPEPGVLAALEAALLAAREAAVLAAREAAVLAALRARD